jgi:hypothetical protein
MSLEVKVTQPNPGSKKAREQGCTCPVLDNYYGDGIGRDENGITIFWISEGCPIHAPSKTVISPKTSVGE